jgi:hypothetical protein
VLQVKQKIPAIDEVDVTVVCVSPARGPRLRNFEIVAAVGEVGPASHDLDVTDREVVFAAEMSTKMFVVDATGMLVVPFFLSSIFIIAVVVLGKDGDHSREKQCGTDGSNCCESFHVKPRFKFSQNADALAPFVTKPR